MHRHLSRLVAFLVLPSLALVAPGCGHNEEEWQAQLAKYSQLAGEHLARLYLHATTAVSSAVDTKLVEAGEPLIDGPVNPHDILRVKGFLAVKGKDMRLVLQGVGNRLQHYYDRPLEAHEGRKGRIVVIGLKGLDRSAIAAARRCPSPAKDRGRTNATSA